MSTLDRPPTENQIATALPGPKTYLTGHDPETGKSIIHSTRPVKWTTYDNNSVEMSCAYTNEFHPDLNADADVAAHEATLHPDGTSKIGLVKGGGTVLRYVDFAPSAESIMHRTQSLDFGIVVEGEVESVLDSGKVVRMGRGDVMVQRATMHAWRNPSKTEWARMIFCLQDCKPLVVRGTRLREDLGRGMDAGHAELPSSGNDQD